MIAEIGHFSLIIALFIAIIQSIVPMIGAMRGEQGLMGVAKTAAIAQFLLIAVAFAALMWCYITSDFSVLNVVENSHSDKPMLYKISGVWSNHEGSMLLWVFILSIYGMAVAIFGGNLPATLRSRALAVQAMIGVGFILFILLTSNPFARINPAPINGEGLNPLLQDPGLAFHPPFLYLGYVGFSMAFSFAIAALIEGRVDAAWARWVRPWTLVAWCFLTTGITLGSWWAYYTLGWGGWWYWDPVENASFMPWLAGTALLHSSIVVEKRDTLKTWTILLTIITFSLSLLGTFLVRSGVLTSVHSFAVDPARGVFVLCLLALVTGGSLVLYAVRAPTLKTGGLFAPISREGTLLLNNVLLSAATGTVLLGTLYPLFADALKLGKVSVGAPFFNAVFVPMMIPLVLIMGISPLFPWKRGDLLGIMQRMKLVLILTVLVMVAVWLCVGGSASMLWSAFWIGLAIWLFFGTLLDLVERLRLFRIPFNETITRAKNLPRAAYGMVLSHCAIALVIIGITGVTSWSTEKIQVMKIGETVEISGYEVTLKNVEDNIKVANWTATRADFIVNRNGKFYTELHPEKRMYIMPPRPTTNAAISTNLISDLYVVIGESDGKGGYVTNLYHKPLVPWIFIGGILVAIGGAISLTDRRLRVGVPMRRVRG
jgi:cytochrome c-type biogenesis protein CcmF